MSNEPNDEVVAQARAAVRHYLEQINPDRGMPGQVPNFLHLMSTFDAFPKADIKEALIGELAASDLYERLSAARILLEAFPLVAHRKQAVELFQSELQTENFDTLIIALCVASCFEELPLELRDQIATLLKHPDEQIRLHAAVVGLSCESLTLSCTRVVVQTMEQLPLDQGITLAAFCLRNGLLASKAWAYIKRNTNRANRNRYFESLVLQMDSVAPIDKTATQLIKIAKDKNLSGPARAAAIKLFKAFPANHAGVNELLMDAFASAEPLSVYAACHVLYFQKLSGTNEIINGLLHYLCHTNVDVRETAANCLYRCCPPLTNESQIEVLLQRLNAERDIEVFWKLLEICITAGAIAIPHLTQLLSNTSPLRKLLLLLAMNEMGPESCNQLLRQFATSSQPEAKVLLAQILSTARLQDSQILLQLRNMLHSNDAEDTRLALLAMSHAGNSIAFMTPDLLTLMAGSDVEVARMASNVIEGIGPSALPYLHSYQVKDSRHELLISLLESCGRTPSEHELSWYDDIAELRLFTLVAGEIQKQGSVSLRKALENLVEILAANGLKVSESTLQRKIRSVQHKLSSRKSRPVKLLEFYRKKQRLTSEGTNFLSLAQSYLKMLDADY